MQIDPKIVEAALPIQWHPTDKENEEVARRVLKAASECVPDEVVDAYIRAHWLMPLGLSVDLLFGDQIRLARERERVRAALSAGLAKWAEEE